MSKGITGQQIRALYESTIEDTTMPRAILAYLKERNGKTLTERDVPKLKARTGDPDIAIRKVAGMTNLEWGTYSRTGGNKGGSLLVAYTSGAPTIDAAWIEERNAAYFAAADERNARREKMLGGFGSAFDACAEAITKLAEAKAALAKVLTDYEAPLYEARFAIRKHAKEALGLDIDP